jgi:NADH-quinone oxidoreductase subunit M
MLTMYQRVAFGPITHESNRSLADLNPREVLVASALVVFIVWIGVYPRPFIERIEPTVDVLLGRMAQAGATRYLETPPRAATAVQTRAD